LIAALVASVLDGITTYVGITRCHGQEAGMVAWTVARAGGPHPTILMLKAVSVLCVLGIGVSGTSAEPGWWRARPHQQGPSL
jgi:hypothetical protein